MGHSRWSLGRLQSRTNQEVIVCWMIEWFIQWLIHSNKCNRLFVIQHLFERQSRDRWTWQMVGIIYQYPFSMLVGIIYQYPSICLLMVGIIYQQPILNGWCRTLCVFWLVLEDDYPALNPEPRLHRPVQPTSADFQRRKHTICISVCQSQSSKPTQFIMPRYMKLSQY